MKLVDLFLKVKVNIDDEINIYEVNNINFKTNTISFIKDTVEYKVSNSDDIELLMGTSYFDIKGSRIYEKDILKNQNGDMSVVKYIVGDLFVIYNPECCQYCREGNGYIYTLEEYFMDYKPEIVGNYITNPELFIKLNKYN